MSDTAHPERGHSGATGWEALIPLDWDRLRRLTNEPVPYHLKRWWFCLGGTPAYLLLIQITTGLLLTFFYHPGGEAAYESVRVITHDVSFGWFLRSIHKWSANLMVVTLLLHMLRVFFTRAYRHPRTLNWVFGVGLLLATMGLAFTGYSLVYEQLSYWGATVATNIMNSVPLVGPLMADFVRGGPTVGETTMTRLFLLHVGILPALIIGILGLHLTFVRLHGVTEYEFESGAAPRSGGAARFVPGVLAFALLLGVVGAATAAMSGTVAFDLVGYRFLPGTSRTIFAMLAVVLGAGAYAVAKRHLAGLLVFLTAGVLALAKLLRDWMLGETAAPGTWLAGAAVIAVLMLLAVAFHRLFSERADPDEPKQYDFFPGHALTELMIGTGLLGLLTLLCLIFPAEMGEKANPLMTPEHIKPEWYFYFQFRLLKLTSLAGSVLLTGILFAVLFAWPWVDRLLEKIAPGRNLPVYVGVVGFLGWLVLTVWESMVH